MQQADAEAGFREHFGGDPTLVARAPGRVNLIGEHTDYNDGWVLPAAMDFATWTAIRARADRMVRIHAANRGQGIEFNLDGGSPGDLPDWGAYARGTLLETIAIQPGLSGAEIWVGGDIPEGAGLSSSAALEISLAMAMLEVHGRRVDRTELARIAQRTEHHYAGTRCGIMDPFVSAHARAHHALLLDCRSLEFRHLLIPTHLRLVICDSGVKHALASGEYNVRRSQCQAGVEELRKHEPGIQALRDVTPDFFAERSHLLPEVIRRRCRHVILENARTLAFAEALEKGDETRLGQLMAQSHESLRDDYEVSCPELDLLVELSRQAPGTIGARMTGGGFGGCTVNLVRQEEVMNFQQRIVGEFERTMARAPRVFVTTAGSGASVQRLQKS